MSRHGTDDRRETSADHEKIRNSTERQSVDTKGRLTFIHLLDQRLKVRR
jgi:hypothetical protein